MRIGLYLSLSPVSGKTNKQKTILAFFTISAIISNYKESVKRHCRVKCRSLIDTECRINKLRSLHHFIWKNKGKMLQLLKPRSLKEEPCKCGTLLSELKLVLCQCWYIRKSEDGLLNLRLRHMQSSVGLLSQRGQNETAFERGESKKKLNEI